MSKCANNRVVKLEWYKNWFRFKIPTSQNSKVSIWNMQIMYSGSISYPMNKTKFQNHNLQASENKFNNVHIFTMSHFKLGLHCLKAWRHRCGCSCSLKLIKYKSVWNDDSDHLFKINNNNKFSQYCKAKIYTVIFILHVIFKIFTSPRKLKLIIKQLSTPIPISFKDKSWRRVVSSCCVKFWKSISMYNHL